MRSFKPFSTRTLALAIVLLAGAFALLSISLADETRPLDARALELTEQEKQWIRDHPVIRVVGPKSFPPFHFYEEDGLPQGISADTMHAIARDLGFQVDPLPPMPWNQVLKSVKSHEVDWIPCIAKTAQREAFIEFSQPYLSFPLVILSTKDSGFIGRVEDLNGKTVACVKKVAWLEWLERDGVAFTPLYVDTPKDMLHAVSMGKADATIDNLASATFNIDKYGLSNIKVAAPSGYDNYDLFFGVRKDWPELVSILNKGLTALGPDREGDLRGRWLSVRYEHGIRRWDIVKWAGGTALVALLIVTLVILWNRKLGKEISRRRIAEADLHKSLSILNETMEHAPIGIQILETHKGKITLLMENQESRNIKGLPIDDDLTVIPSLEESGGYRFLDIDTKAPFPTADLATRRAFKGETVENQRVLLERPDGSIVPLEASASPLFDEHKKVVAIFNSYTDISERLKQEKDLAHSQKMEAIGTLTGGIAHDFNNILSIMIGNAELASGEVPSWSATYAKLSEIKTAGMRARDMVRQLLSFSRKAEIARKPVKFSSTIQESVSLLRATLPSNVEIRSTGTDHPGIILADPSQVHQILINLCTNAAHAMAKKGGILEIALDSIMVSADDVAENPDLTPGAYMRLKVTDTGIGMPPKVARRIFDPYFTTKTLDRGTGMGLSVVHGIVQSYSGTIEVDSSPDQGTVVTIMLPVSDAAYEDPAKPSIVMMGGTERIMLVDDEPQIVDMTRQMLERIGYSVEAFTDSKKALKEFMNDSDKYDLIVTDMTMPHMMGDILAAKVLEVRSSMPIILCTGFSDKIDRARAMSMGVSAFLQKPIVMKEMALAIRGVLDGEG